MSEIAYCPRGGQEGIRTSSVEIIQFNKDVGSKSNSFIPLPGLTVVEQMSRIKKDKGKCDLDNSQYFESSSGSHGWCCSKCGNVVQWG